MIGRLVLKDCSNKSNSQSFESTITELSKLPQPPEKSVLPDDVINASVERNKSSHDNVVNASMSVGLNNALRQ
jgi:hypothetical protein